MGRRSSCRTRHSTCSTACASGLCPIEWSCATTWRCVNLLKVQQGPATGCALTVARCTVRQRSLLRLIYHQCHRPLDTPLWNNVCNKLSFFLNSLSSSSRRRPSLSSESEQCLPVASPGQTCWVQQRYSCLHIVADCGNRMVRRISPVGVSWFG